MPFQETLAKWRLAQQASNSAEHEYHAALHKGRPAVRERARMLMLEQQAESLLQQVLSEVSRESRREASMQ